jgi:hypothetical protein
MCPASISLAPPLSRRAADKIASGPVGLGQGALVRTIFGSRPVENLMAGDVLLDHTGQIVELRGIRKRRCRSRDLVQVTTADGVMVLGRATPVLSDDWRLQLLHGRAAMVPAHRLLDGSRVRNGSGDRIVHELIFDAATVLAVHGFALRFQHGAQAD